MRIIKQGKKYEDVLGGTCRDCGCEVECNRAEAEWVGATYYLRCPNCSRFIQLNQKELGPVAALIEKINEEIRYLNQEKENAVLNQDFGLAAKHRDRAVKLKKERGELEQKLKEP